MLGSTLIAERHELEQQIGRQWAVLGQLVSAGRSERVIDLARSALATLESGLRASNGPLVIMAGERNWRSIHMRNAFSSHPAAWSENIHLYVHDTDLEADAPATAGVG